MNLSDWFAAQLTSSAEGFAWAVEQQPVERRQIEPPERLGDWPAARHIFHMYHYERELALPHMRYWLGGELPDYESYAGDDKPWEEEAKGWSVERLLQAFRTIRAEQVALLPGFSESLWEEKHMSAWGRVTIRWIVTKTFQHTMEHTHDVLRMVLFWDPRTYKEEQEGQAQA